RLSLLRIHICEPQPNMSFTRTNMSLAPANMSLVTDFESGTDVSVENKADGFTHGFLVTFKDEKGREIYLPHPAHQEFVKLVGPRIDKVLVFDYWAKK
ncbi:MAG TPA: Dabb family protein, partial [Planctomycetaceae bacterium]|nr:Dabb family protein [Planctomycetaceae bacterium]